MADSIVRQFLTGEVVEVSGVVVSDDLPDATAIDVVVVDETEVEIMGGSQEAFNWFLEVTVTQMTDSVTLRNGLDVQLGSLGGVPAAGYAFCLPVGSRFVYGQAPPKLPLESTIGMLNRAYIREAEHGIRIEAPRSSVRRPNVYQMIPGRFLMDVTTAVPAARPARGLKVAGGTLSRSDSNAASPYLVLEGSSHVTYFFPMPGTEVDATVDAAASAVIEISQG